MKHYCPMCGEQWDDDVCASCGWREATIGGMAKQKRGYSREFTPQTDRRVRFEVDRIPPTLFDSVKAKARREGVSLRALTLRLWRQWLDDEAKGSASHNGPNDQSRKGI